MVKRWGQKLVNLCHNEFQLLIFFFSLDVLKLLADKELEARQKVLEERRLREEVQKASLVTNSTS
jgi:hypothetical protein